MRQRTDSRPELDMEILNHAVKLGEPLKGTPYKGITIKEALTYIGYPNVAINFKG